MARCLSLTTVLKSLITLVVLITFMIALIKTRVLEPHVPERSLARNPGPPILLATDSYHAKDSRLERNNDGIEGSEFDKNKQDESDDDDKIGDVEDNDDDSRNEDISESVGEVVSIKDEIEILGNILTQKLAAVYDVNIEPLKPTCRNKSVLANSCEGSKRCLRTQLPDDPKARVQQLVGPNKLRLSPTQHELLRKMAKKVEGFYDIILLTAASSNHFNESQALLQTVHTNLFPILKNFTLIFYDIGLTSQEKALMMKNCRCQYLHFPFEVFPEFLRELRCYSWKPVMIKSMLQKANIIVWMDASVRFLDQTENIQVVIGNARKRGVQIGGSNVISAFRTFRSMYHFFGDEPCAYFALGMAKATFGIYHNEIFVDRAILAPWAACALTAECMCPPDRFMGTCRQSKDMFKLWREQGGPIIYGLCHLYDQSAISLILHKLYQESFRWVYCNTNYFSRIQRDDLAGYFS
uniref:Uncharacterized protein n=1 Tax=Biomphalaria glabrata TaxID=6526 RepID=A0A2C9M1V7_BIOGL